MGKMYMGILGGFKGTVGTVVGSTNKNGDDIIRVKSKRTRTANSEKQLQQQSRFSLVTGFMKPLNPVLRIGLGVVSGSGMSAYNFACQQAMKEAVTGVAPDLALDYGKIRISQGGLGMALNVAVEFADGKAVFTWGESTPSQIDTDQAVLLAYNVHNGEVSCSTKDFTRASKEGELLLPYAEEGDRMLCYMFFRSAVNPLEVSTSQFVGQLVV